MQVPAYISAAVEGPSDEAVLRRIAQHAGAIVHRVQVQNGKDALRRALPGYNAAAQWSRWLVFVDLDEDFPCAAALAADWLATPAPFMRFRVVVRAIEAWLLADADRFSTFLPSAEARFLTRLKRFWIRSVPSSRSFRVASKIDS